MLTPTLKSRTRFVNVMVLNISSQTYPHDLLEWIVVGDDDEMTKNVFLEAFEKLPNISCRYFSCDIEGDIGKK